MPKHRARWLVLVSMLSAVLLSGCITTLAPVQPLPLGASASVTEVAMTVGAGGVKHYAWTECFGEAATYSCLLIYARVAMGAVIYSRGFVQTIGDFARYPDVAVSSTGDAYVVYSECTDFLNCVDYWSLFPADHPENVEITENVLHTSSIKSEGRPVVEARGNDVYAAYFIEVSSATRLRYRQLAGGSRSGYIDNTTLNPVNPNLAVDSNGDLHAVWVRNPVTDTTVAYANNIGAANSFNAVTTFEGGANILITTPDIALDDEDRAYIAYTINSGSDDTLKVQCMDAVPASNCYRGVTTLTVPQASGPWNVYRNVHLELIAKVAADQPNVVFAATNNVETYNEVWWYHPPATGGNTAPTQVTDTPTANEGEPLIVEENSDAGDVPVVAWRMYQNFIVGAQAHAGNAGHCEGDVFVTYANVSNIRQVFEDRGTCDNSGLDLAANGAWVAGVWVDVDPDVLIYHAAWTAFNAYGSYLPLVSR